MTLTLELTPEQEARLNEAAQQQGVPPADVVAALLDSLPAETQRPAQPATWGARVATELQAEGVIGMWDGRAEETPELARQLRTQAAMRNGSR